MRKIGVAFFDLSHIQLQRKFGSHIEACPLAQEHFKHGKVPLGLKDYLVSTLTLTRLGDDELNEICVLCALGDSVNDTQLAEV